MDVSVLVKSLSRVGAGRSCRNRAAGTTPLPIHALSDAAGPGPRELLQGVVHLLPERTRPGFRRAVHPIDQAYLQRARPDLVGSADVPWRQRR
jgi:hypothetical protein